MKIKIILPAWKIPLGATVTKRTGTKKYKLLDKLRVFPRQGSKETEKSAERQEIRAESGVLFLVRDGDANAILAATELIWATTFEELAHHLEHVLGPNWI